MDGLDRLQRQIIASPLDPHALLLQDGFHRRDDALVRLLRPASELLPRARLIHWLQTSSKVTTDVSSDLVLLVMTRAVSQTLGLVMQDFIQRMFILNREIAYWRGALQSSWYVGFYVMQTCPQRLWRNARTWMSSGRSSALNGPWLSGILEGGGLHPPWARWLWTARAEFQRNQRALEIARMVHATSIGILLDGYLSLLKLQESLGNSAPHPPDVMPAVSNTMFLMESILENAGTPRTDVSEFESHVLAVVEAKTRGAERRRQGRPFSIQQESTSAYDQLARILQDCLPHCASSSMDLAQKHARPSRLTRYWLPILAALFCGSTFLRVLVKESAQLALLAVDTMSTAYDFWSNWVVSPVRNLIRTIRHDDNSDIAIMSKKSLETDRASLERMVVEFVQDHAATAQRQPTSNIDLVTTNLKEGDVTPVLKAYERDLRSPFIGAIRGDLVRALLIQIQKTKVDIEVAMSGIDALLKSQELVFRYVGFVPLLSLSGDRGN